ncbi:hypothetical protein FGIG_10073 [Fasciola gigantica]|uniref:G-protein coupled receptors family 1 profile domain-containing protein n=1 Tax=Fasciola gigantica TaxID=46835 RepID=A0A504ZCR3_FASGI|nr:hypothetical protein FGIG_10073 [Fasciola gigantica]
MGTVAHTGNSKLDSIYCYLCSYDSAYRPGPILSVQNLTWISISRLLSVFFALFYRMHQTFLVVVYAVYLTTVGLLVYIPIPLSRTFENGTCLTVSSVKTQAMGNLEKAHSCFWFTFVFLIPAVCLTTCHFLIIWHIGRNRTDAIQSDAHLWHSGLSLSETTKPNSIQRNEHANRRTGSVAAVRSSASLDESAKDRIRELIRSSIVLSVLFFVLYSYDAFRYLKGTIRKEGYGNGSFVQQVGVLLMTIFSATNPCVMFFMIQPLRRVFVKKALHTLRFFHRVVSQIKHSKGSSTT